MLVNQHQSSLILACTRYRHPKAGDDTPAADKTPQDKVSSAGASITGILLTDAFGFVVGVVFGEVPVRIVVEVVCDLGDYVDKFQWS